MAFQKATCMQAYVKASFFGPKGSGKTLTALLMAEGLAKRAGKRVAYVDTEYGTSFYTVPVPERRVHPDAFDFDAIYTKSIATVLRDVKALDPAEHGVIVIDSISHLWRACIEAYEGKMTSIETIPMSAWGAIKKPYKELLDWLLDCPFHVFILGRQKDIYGVDDRGEVRKVGVGMRAEGETEYEPHLCFRFEERIATGDGKQSPVRMFVEKDRTSVLDGRTYPFPSFKTLEPMLALLGDVQAKAEDEEERVAADGELLDRQKAKKAEKAEKSQGILADMRAQLLAASDLKALSGVARDIKKLSRYLLDEHKGALRAIYEERRKALVEQVAPQEAV